MSHTSIASQLLAKYGQGQNGAIPRLWWMEDGATAHYSLIVRQRLHQLFHNRVVGRGHAVPWPSPELTPLNFFLWGYLKDKVHETVPPSLAVLQQRIVQELHALQRTRKVRNAVNGMLHRATKCIAPQGHQFE